MLRHFSTGTTGRLRSLIRRAMAAAAMLLIAWPAAAQEPDLAPRRPIAKPLHTILRDTQRRDQVIVKFAEGLQIRARDGQLVDRGTGALARDQGVLRGLASGRWLPLFRLPEGRLDVLRRNAERSRRRVISDLNLWFHLMLRPGLDAQAAIDALNGLDIVEAALPVDEPVPPPLPPDFEPNQPYLGGLPSGVNAFATWQDFGGRGAGVTICDIEYSWNFDHLDLPPASLIGPPPLDPFNNNYHGTAVLGMLSAIDNGWGTTGIAPDATLLTAAANIDVDGQSVYDLPSAILEATNALQPGDILLIEQQTAGPRWTGVGDYGLMPVEWKEWIYDAIVTAVGNGIIVVEAAGNGSQDLDDPIYGFGHAPFTPEGDSGAYIVGAGSSIATLLSISNYGSTVDLQGLGLNIWTTGYGNAYNLEGPNLYYSQNFGATSGATAMVAACCALFQSNYQAITGTRLTADDMKFWLQYSGYYPSGGTYETSTSTIGGRPDVHNAIDMSTRPILVSLLDGAPRLVPPGQPVDLRVGITEVLGAYEPGTAVLRYRFDAGVFRTLPLQPVPGAPGEFTVEMPAAYCGESPEYYFEALATDGSTQTTPIDAPVSVYDFDIGVDQTSIVFAEDFENGLPPAWSTTGLWHVTDTCATPSPCGGTHWAYFGDDTSCDYDFGHVVGRLTTPDIILPTGGTNARYRMDVCHWLVREAGGLFERASLMIGNTEVAKFKDTTLDWDTASVPIPFLGGDSVVLDFLFDSENASNNFFKGWLIDNLAITRTVTTCDLVRPCPADCAGGNGQVDVEDLLAMLAAWGSSDPAFDIAPDGAADGVVNVWDLLAVLTNWGSCDGG